MRIRIPIAVVLFLMVTPIAAFPAGASEAADKKVLSQTPAEEECEGHLSRMQERIKKMQGQMDRIHGSRHQEERQKLFEEHWETMQQSMGMMGNLYDRCMKGGPMVGGPMRHRGMMEGMMMGGQMPPSTDPAQLPESDSMGAKLVGRYCTQCHGLPTPGLHTSEGWLPVTQRMNTRMQWMNENSRMSILAPTASEFEEMTLYLQKYAAP